MSSLALRNAKSGDWIRLEPTDDADFSAELVPHDQTYEQRLMLHRAGVTDRAPLRLQLKSAPRRQSKGMLRSR